MESPYLYARDSDTDVSRLDHADIVGTVSDREEWRLGTPLDQFDHKSLLQRRYTTYDGGQICDMAL